MHESRADTYSAFPNRDLSIPKQTSAVTEWHLQWIQWDTEEFRGTKRRLWSIFRKRMCPQMCPRLRWSQLLPIYGRGQVRNGGETLTTV